MDSANLIDRVVGSVDAQLILELATELTNIPSVTGSEEGVARALGDAMRECGLRVHFQEVEPDRLNVIGILEGRGTGRRLMLNGHLDTEVAGDEDLWDHLGYPPAYPPRGEIRDDWLWGLGSYNMKGALAAFVGAASAIRRSGVELAGDLMIAGVVGENGRAQVSSYEGALFRGGGVGTQYLVTHGGIADAAIVGEPTDLEVVYGHLGNVWVQVDVTTEACHINEARREQNAVLLAQDFIAEIEQLDEELAARDDLSFAGLRAHAKVAAIEGGWPYRLSQNPALCKVFIDVRYPPHKLPMEMVHEVQRRMRNVADRAGVPVTVSEFQSIPGADVGEDHWLVSEVASAHESVNGRDAVRAVRRYHSDAATLLRYGIPALNYGPSGEAPPIEGALSQHAPAGEALPIGKMSEAARTYALATARICG